MPSFGEKLKLEREKRKITLDQISSSTKIGTRMLQALEEDRFNQLPGGIFNKGFVRAYARVVGLDEEQTVADYLEASGDAPAVKIEPGAHDTSGEARGRDAATRAPIRITDESSGRLEIRAEAASRQLPWGIFAVALLIIALALSFWNHRRLEQQKEAPRSVPEASTQSPSGQPSATQAAEPAGTPATTAPAPAPAGKSNTPAAQPASSSSSAPAAGSAVVPAAKLSQPLPNSQPAVAASEFTVVVQAHEDSWLSVTADGTPAGSATLVAGTERAIHGRNTVVVRAGNVGGVTFLLNGKKLDVRGDYGDVKTVTIGPTGIIAITTASPPTP